GRMQPVDGLGADPDRSVEAERVVRRREVVVDRLRDPDDREPLLRVEPGRDAERVLAADRDKSVEALLLEVPQHGLDAVDLVRVRARGPEDRAAAREQAGDLARPERLEPRLDETAPAFADPDDLVPPDHRGPRDRPNDRVEPRAIPAAREDADLHGAILRATRGVRPAHESVTKLPQLPEPAGKLDTVRASGNRHESLRVPKVGIEPTRASRPTGF